MDFKSVFTKKKKHNSAYGQAIGLYGNTTAYTETNYRAIAREGYKGNWTIFRCIQEIIKACVQLEFKVKRTNRNGEKEEVKDHYILDLLKMPNPLQNRNEFLKRLIIFTYLGGEAPLQKIIAGGRVTELYTYRPDFIDYTPTNNFSMPYKDIRYKQTISIAPETFTIWKEFNPADEFDGLGRGMAITEPVLKNGDFLNSLLDWNVSLVQNGANVSGVLMLEEMGEREFERFKQELKNAHEGKDRVGKFLTLNGVKNFIQTSHNPKDMDWLDGKDSTIRDICIGLGVDPIIIGLNESASYNNKNEAEKGLYTKVAIPLMQDLAQMLTNFLELGEGEYIEVDYKHVPCLQEDVKEMFDRVNSSTFMTINEKREKVGLEPISGGDKIMLPMNLVEFGEQDQASKENKNFIY